MSKPILNYFDGRGKAEIIRLVWAAAGVEVSYVQILQLYSFQSF